MTASIAPPAHPLWGHLPEFGKDPLGFLTHCARNYGAAVPLRFLHLRAVLLLDPIDIERVLITEHLEYTKPAWLRTAAVSRLLGKGLVSSDGEEWRNQRRTCQPAFQLRRLDDYGATISALTDGTISDWKSGQTLDLQREMGHLTLRVIARTLLGVDPPGWAQNVSRSMDTLMARFASRTALYGLAPLPPSLAEILAARNLNRIVDGLIHQDTGNHGHTDSHHLCPVLLDSLRAAGSNSGPSESNRVRDQVKTFLGAGYESSALVLSWAFLTLAANPASEAALVAEIASVLPDRSPMPADLPRLPYTEAVIKEILRLYPPLWMTGRQAKENCRLGGINVPKGTLVMTSQWAVHRLPGLFNRPDEFRPERWLNGETSNLARCAFFPFGGGPRICIGQSFAMMEAVLLLAGIARRFRIEPVTPGAHPPWATMTLRPPAGIIVRATARQT